ncbi:MAG: isoprenylcysteine carboxylmethyltransferase family protein [Brevinematales bacterium]|nr:isoprenylcysteine carboxylmethyltransferase family protein [Brevinematales bacterium]
MTFFDYFQFITVIAFIGTLIVRALTIAVRQGIVPVVFGNEKTLGRRIVNLMLFPAMLYWLYEIINASLHLGIRLLPGLMYTSLFGHIAPMIVGCVLITAGFVLFVTAAIQMGGSFRIGIDEKHPGGLVTSGVFSFSRNPIYLFFFSFSTGIFLLNGSIIFLVWICIFVPIIHSQALSEESFLESRFGDSYRNYMKRVRRYL